MRTIDHIFSMCQSDLSDESFTKVQRQEWYDYAERVLYTIGSQTRVFLSTPLLFPQEQSYQCTLPASLKPYKLLKVVRGQGLSNGKAEGGVECREYSYQAIDSVNRTSLPFPINNTPSGDIGKYGFHAVALPDESVDLWFGAPFEREEWVRVHLIGLSEVIPVHWKHLEPILVPDWMTDTMRFGMLTKALERLQFQNSNNEYMNRYQRAESLYSASLRALRVYTTNLKDENSFPQQEAFVWLPE